MKINRSGMTLVEVIVSIAILGILAVAFLPAFSTGIRFIISNGDRIKEMYSDQDSIERRIAQGATSDTATMTIVFPSKTIEVKGENVSCGSFNLFLTKK